MVYSFPRDRMKQDHSRRWNSDRGRAFIAQLKSAGFSGNGLELNESPFGLRAESGRKDLRGVSFGEGTQLRRVSFVKADLSGAKFNNAWLEGCVFEDIVFEKTSFRNIAEHGNTFTECNFNCSVFNGAVLGFRGSRFLRCVFNLSDFRSVGFIRPEFESCVFENCIYEGVDFNGAFFKSCEFRGPLRGVWFRGGFPLASDYEKFGDPRPNRMLSVSFRQAQLIDVTFSDNCDLSTVDIPTDGTHLLFRDWPDCLKCFYDHSRSWKDPLKRAAELFYKSHEVHAKNQDCYVLGACFLIESFGQEIAQNLWNLLCDCADTTKMNP